MRFQTQAYDLPTIYRDVSSRDPQYTHVTQCRIMTFETSFIFKDGMLFIANDTEGVSIQICSKFDFKTVFISRKVKFKTTYFHFQISRAQPS